MDIQGRSKKSWSWDTRGSELAEEKMVGEKDA